MARPLTQLVEEDDRFRVTVNSEVILLILQVEFRFSTGREQAEATTDSP